MYKLNMFDEYDVVTLNIHINIPQMNVHYHNNDTWILYFFDQYTRHLH